MLLDLANVNTDFWVLIHSTIAIPLYVMKTGEGETSSQCKHKLLKLVITTVYHILTCDSMTMDDQEDIQAFQIDYLANDCF
jgi:hypothetical protein